MKTILIMAISLISIFSCRSSDTFTSMSIAEFSKYTDDKNVQLLDVRTADEFKEGHILGAVNIDVLDNGFTIKSEASLDKDKPVALYCRSGKRSKKAAAILAGKGYKVYELDKGIISWQNAGNALFK